MIDQNAAHHASADGEEVSPVLPLHPAHIDQPEVGFVDQGCGLNRVTGTLVVEMLTRDPVQFRPCEFHDLADSGLVAGAPRAQQVSDLWRRCWIHRPPV